MYCFVFLVRVALVWNLFVSCNVVLCCGISMYFACYLFLWYFWILVCCLGCDVDYVVLQKKERKMYPARCFVLLVNVALAWCLFVSCNVMLRYSNIGCVCIVLLYRLALRWQELCLFPATLCCGILIYFACYLFPFFLIFVNSCNSC